MFQFFARDCGTPAHATTLARCRAIGLVGLLGHTASDDAWVRLAFEDGRLVLGRPTAVATLDRDRFPDIDRLPLKDASDILRAPWWEASDGGCIEGSAILRPTVVPGVAMLVGALCAPLHGTLPFALEALTTCDAQGRPVATRAVDSVGTNLDHVLRMPVWGEPAFGLGSTFHPTAARAAAEVHRRAIAIAVAGGGKEELLALSRSTSDHGHFWSLCIASIAQDPIYRATLIHMARHGHDADLVSFDSITTPEMDARRDRAMRAAIAATLAVA